MKNYIVKIQEKEEHKFDSLKEARKFIRSVININEVRGIAEKLELYKEITRRSKIDEIISDPEVFGKI